METRKYQLFSGSTLKLIAVITMLIDHVTLHWLSFYPQANQPLTDTPGSMTYSMLGRAIGRTAFPIYCFLIAEGYRHTHDRRQYGLRLLLFALISEIPWNLVHSGRLIYPQQNVFFTLFLGFCCIAAYEKYKDEFAEQLMAMLILLLTALLLQADYGIRGVALILLMYMLHDAPIVMGAVGYCLINESFAVMPAFFLTGMYNGKRGFVRGKLLKYFFYAFYPLHLLVLFFIRREVGGF